MFYFLIGELKLSLTLQTQFFQKLVRINRKGPNGTKEMETLKIVG